MRHRQWMQAGVLALALLAAACGGQGKGGNSASPATTGKDANAAGRSAVLKTEKTSLGRVLANARGRTLYWFAIDTPAASRCDGPCLNAWPIVRGTPTAARGATIPGRLGTIKRPGGHTQATWNGRPLYTYFGDAAPGETYGNMVNAFGGLWHAVVLPAASAAPSAAPSASPSRVSR